MLILAKNWWTFVLRGIVAILFGVLALVVPAMALLTLVWIFGIYAIVDGIFSIVAAFRKTPEAEHQPRWWVLLIQGIIGIAAGVIAFAVPGLTALALLYLIAIWAIAMGIMEIIAAIRLRTQIRGEWLLAFSGVLSIIFGVLVAIFPGAGALAVAIWIGIYAIILGASLVALGFKLRKWVRCLQPTTPTPTMPVPGPK